MARDVNAQSVAEALVVSLRLLIRRARQVPLTGELTAPQTAALVRLDVGGPSTASALAKLEQISPQSMGATLAALEQHRLVFRQPDPDDRRRVVLSISAAGLSVLRNRRSARTERLRQALADGFTPDELVQLMGVAPLLERLAQKI
jgi:DNA-binding MarR family transcriptional regulator